MDTDIRSKLAEAFSELEIKWRPGAISGKRAMALAYVDARVIMDRLDNVLGIDGWQDEYQVLTDGCVVCTLRVRLGDVWISRSDVGSPSEQPDGGDRTKAAFSDALKRAAAKFGVGRYLWSLPVQWVDYDPAKRWFVRQPVMKTAAVQPAPEPKVEVKPEATLPTGEQFVQRLWAKDAEAGRQGSLVKEVVAAGKRQKLPADLAQWDERGVRMAAKIVAILLKKEVSGAA